MNPHTNKVATFIPILILPLVLFGRVSAQEKKEPPPRRLDVNERADTSSGHEARLPKIDLPEFVITGREMIELPPAGKVDQGGGGSLLDASKLTALGEKKEDASRSAKSSARLTDGVSAYDGKLNLGYGRFKSPYGEVWFGKKYDEGDFNLHGCYYSHTDYVPHAKTARGSLDAGGGFYLPRKLRFLGGAKFFGQAAYEDEKYRFFGTPTPSLERTADRFEVGAGIRGNPNAPVSYEHSFHFSRLTLEDKDNSREDQLKIALRASSEVGGFQLRSDFLYAAEFLEQSIAAKNPHYLRTSAGFRKLLFKELDISAGVGIYLYRNSDTKFISKVYPTFVVQYHPQPQLKFFAQFEPSIEQNSLSRLLSSNPYIGNDVRINHQDVFVNLSTGVQFELLNRGTARVYLKYQRVRNFPLYVDPSTLVYIAVVPVPYRDWDIVYDRTTRFVSLNGEFHLSLTKIDRLSGAMTILSSHNSKTDDQVPYLSPLILTSNYSHEFPFGLTTQLNGQFVGQRTADLQSGQKLSSYFLLGATAEYQVGKNFSFLLRLNNIFDEQYSIWNRYQELPFTMRGEISVRW